MKEKTEGIRGYKLFDSDWTCRGFQFEVGKVFAEDVKPELGKIGFHFCTKADDCFTYGNYHFDSQKTKAAEVISLGEVVSGKRLHCTNKILILREILWEELLDLVNSGEGNTGRKNSGDCNSGYSNSGYSNSGNCNSGDCNSGYKNSGYRNSGDCNSGDFNSGNCNSGDFNKANRCTGCFNTKEQKIYLFNRPSEWTFSDWQRSSAYKLLMFAPANELEYIKLKDMTEEEKAKHPEAQTTGGYLKKIDKEKNMTKWWSGLTEEEKSSIKSIPNFDGNIFKEITGIDVGED